MKLKLTRDKCQCTACEEFFNSTKAFDKHRIGPYTARRCRTVDVMHDIGMSRNSRGFWITSKRTKFTAAQSGFAGDRQNPMGWMRAIFDVFGRDIECFFDKKTGNVETIGRVNQRELDEIIRLFKLADPFSKQDAAHHG